VTTRGSLWTQPLAAAKVASFPIVSSVHKPSTPVGFGRMQPLAIATNKAVAEGSSSKGA
jgi:hypothetical protein